MSSILNLLNPFRQSLSSAEEANHNNDSPSPPPATSPQSGPCTRSSAGSASSSSNSPSLVKEEKDNQDSDRDSEQETAEQQSGGDQGDDSDQDQDPPVTGKAAAASDHSDSESGSEYEMAKASPSPKGKRPVAGSRNNSRNSINNKKTSSSSRRAKSHYNLIARDNSTDEDDFPDLVIDDKGQKSESEGDDDEETGDNGKKKKRFTKDYLHRQNGHDWANPRTVLPAWKGQPPIRNPYDFDEDLAMIRFIISQEAGKRLKGIAFWKECEKKKITGVPRTFQSLKSRFWTHVATNPRKYEDLSKQEVKAIMNEIADAGKMITQRSTSSRTVVKKETTTTAPRRRKSNDSDEDEEERSTNSHKDSNNNNGKKKKTLEQLFATTSEESDDDQVLTDLSNPKPGPSSRRTSTPIKVKVRTLIRKDVKEALDSDESPVVLTRSAAKARPRNRLARILTDKAGAAAARATNGAGKIDLASSESEVEEIVTKKKQTTAATSLSLPTRRSHRSK